MKRVLILLIIISMQSALGLRIDMSDFVVYLVLLYILVRSFIDLKYKFYLANKFLIIPLLFFTILSVTNGGIHSVFHLISTIKALIGFLVIAMLVRDDADIRYTLKCFIITTTMSALIGIGQEIVYLTTKRTLVGFISARQLRLFFNETPLGFMLRVPALTGSYILLANYLVIAMIALFCLLSFGLIKRNNFKVYMAFLSMFIALMLTFSRSSEIALIIGILLCFSLKWRHYIIHFIVILLLAILVSIIIGLTDKIAESFIKEKCLLGDLGVRLQLLREGMSGFVLRHPYIGTGIGKANKYTPNVHSWPVHNNFVRIVDEIGIFGFIVYVIIFLRMFLKTMLMLILAEKENKENRDVLIILTGIIFVLTFNLQFHPTTIDYYIFATIAFIEGILIVEAKKLKPLS